MRIRSRCLPVTTALPLRALNPTSALLDIKIPSSRKKTRHVVNKDASTPRTFTTAFFAPALGVASSSSRSPTS